MQIEVQPAGFNVQPVKIPTPTGDLVDGMRFVVIDQSGITVGVTFSAQDWAAFQEYVADPQEAQRRAEVRAKIAMPPDMASRIRGPKH